MTEEPWTVRALRSRIADGCLLLYKRLISPAMYSLAGVSGACRFQPTCSEYAAIAFAEHGLVRGAGMALWRVLRCHPLHRGGFDPVPPKEGRGMDLRQARTRS